MIFSCIFTRGVPAGFLKNTSRFLFLKNDPSLRKLYCHAYDIYFVIFP